MQEIKLTQGLVALVDDQDVELVSRFKWQASIRKNITYARHWSKGRGIYMHRVILNPPKGIQTDHINGDGLDNRRSNLRPSNHAQNGWNSGKRNNTCKYKGVAEHKSCTFKKWRATIGANGKEYYLGYFATQEEAAKAYNAAALKYHGEFAVLNKL